MQKYRTLWIIIGLPDDGKALWADYMGISIQLKGNIQDLKPLRNAMALKRSIAYMYAQLPAPTYLNRVMLLAHNHGYFVQFRQK